MRALVLEGGGAKGCYQMGAYKALSELKVEFDYVVGTSIGAINGAMICQGDWKVAYDLWENISYCDVLDLPDEDMRSFLNDRITMDNVKDKFNFVKNVIENRGIGVSAYKNLLDKYIDEDRVRGSSMKFGLNTFDVKNLKTLNLFIDDIEDGRLKDYLRASSNLIVFKQDKIDGKRLIDGGYLENNPYKMVDELCDEIVIVSLKPWALSHELKKNPKYTIIKSFDENFPNMLDFEKEKMRYGLKLGYDDTMRLYSKL